MLFFEMFSARARHSLIASAVFPPSSPSRKPWLDLIAGVFAGISFPVDFVCVEGDVLTDLIATKHAGLFLVSDRMIRVLSEKQLTGWISFSVRIRGVENEMATGYSGFAVVGRSGPFDLTRSELISKRLFPGAPVSRYLKGKIIDPTTWDGSDFFLAEGYYGILLSERAAATIKSENLSNIELKNLSEVEVPEETAKVLQKRIKPGPQN